MFPFVSNGVPPTNRGVLRAPFYVGKSRTHARYPEFYLGALRAPDFISISLYFPIGKC